MSGSTPADVLELTTDPADALALMGDSTRVVRDDFAGPGGWSTGIADLLHGAGLTEVALEWDAAACLTRVANGHTNTLRADVAAYPVAPFLGRTAGYIGSPPCQTFSMAGNGSGRAHVELLCECVRGILLGRLTYDEAMVLLADAGALDDKDGNPDPRNGLILIPARVIRALLDHDGKGPTDLEWVALEQVPPATPVFEAYAGALRELGFSAVAIKINAADYGVPQTRERIFVLASRVRRVTVPEPTHAKGGEEETLLGPGRLPWPSMARALGWGMDARPYVTVAGGRPDAGGTDPMAVGGTGGRQALAAELKAGRWVARPAGRDNDSRRDPMTEPAMTIRGNADNIRITPADVELRVSTRENNTPRGADEPAPTIAPGHDYASHKWHPRTEEAAEFLEQRGEGWGYTDRPAPTVCALPNGKGTGAEWGGASVREGMRDAMGSEEWAAKPLEADARPSDAIRLREDEGGVIQGFPASYAWQGTSKAKRWEQIGNVVCPPVARRIVAQLLGDPMPEPLPWHRYAWDEELVPFG